MALVSYDYDSGSDGTLEEDEENVYDATPKTIANSQAASQSHTGTTSKQENNASRETDYSVSSMFSSLPKSVAKTSADTNEDEIEDFIPKACKVEKKREKVKITIPALSEYKDDSDNDEPIPKKSKRSAMGSGLIGILPPVKSEPISTKSFIPKSVTLKTTKPLEQNSVKAKSLIPDSVTRKQINTAAIAIKPKKVNKEALDSDDEDDIVIPDTFDEEMWQKVCGREQKKPVLQETVEQQPQDINIAPEPVKPYEGLDNAAFKELVGKKRKEQNINIIDIHESDILPEKDMWMMKAITDPECVPKPTVENPVDPTRRRKHHITYLAEQAKANEQELQNQWAANKFSRNQTRAKYGF